MVDIEKMKALDSLEYVGDWISDRLTEKRYSIEEVRIMSAQLRLIKEYITKEVK